MIKKNNITPKAKKRLSIFLIIIGIVFYFYVTYWINTGLSTNPTIELTDFSVSEDGHELTLNIATNSSVGYVRDINPIDMETIQYIDFYCTFGGINSTLGSKDEFVINIHENCQGICFQREDGYELVLYKNSETNNWEKVTPETE